MRIWGSTSGLFKWNRLLAKRYSDGDKSVVAFDDCGHSQVAGHIGSNPFLQMIHAIPDGHGVTLE